MFLRCLPRWNKHIEARHVHLEFTDESFCIVRQELVRGRSADTDSLLRRRVLCTNYVSNYC